MLWRGLDFSGISGLGDAISAAQAADIVWDNMPWTVNAVTLQAAAGMSVEEFKNSVAQALSGRYQLVQAGAPPSGAVSDSVITAISPNNADKIIGALDSMRAKGYYIVTAPSTPSAASPANVPGTQSSSGTPGTVVGTPSRAQVLQYQAGQAASAPPAGGGMSPSASPAIQRSGLPVRHINRAHVQTAAERKRLLLIASGFAVVFAVALVAIAARD